MNDQGKSVRLSEGIRLYVQKNSSYWWVCVRTEGKEKRFSTKVKIEDDPDGTGEAHSKAMGLAVEVRVKLKYGIETDTVSPTFTAMADKTIEYLQSLTPQKEIYGRYQSVINNYLKPFFKRKPIDQINRHQIHLFYEWRQSQTDGGISLTQKRVTNKALLHIFNYACDHGHVEQYQIPDLPSVTPKQTVRREFFPKKELDLVLGNFEGFIKESRNKKTREIRKTLECYVNFLVGTGARPGNEVLELRYGDLELSRLGGDWLWIAKITKGKNVHRKGVRQIVLGDRAVRSIEGMIDMNPELRGNEMRAVMDKYPQRKIFSVSYRDSSPEYGRPFNGYLEYIKLEKKNYTLYSLRHTYITQRLLDDTVPRRAIAKQCGTSEEMIEAYYDHVISLDYAQNLKQSDGYRDQGLITLDQFIDK